MGGQWIYAAENEFRFVSLLPEYILKDFMVRPFINKYGWNHYQRWRDNFPKIKIKTCPSKVCRWIISLKTYVYFIIKNLLH